MITTRPLLSRLHGSRENIGSLIQLPDFHLLKPGMLIRYQSMHQAVRHSETLYIIKDPSMLLPGIFPFPDSLAVISMDCIHSTIFTGILLTGEILLRWIVFLISLRWLRTLLLVRSGPGRL